MAVAKRAWKHPCFDCKNLVIVFKGSSAIFINSFTLFHKCFMIKFPLAAISQKLIEKKI